MSVGLVRELVVLTNYIVLRREFTRCTFLKEEFA